MAISAEHDVPENEAVLLIPRAYQLEMLGESLKQNIIVAMDTGSGKTHVAVLRIQEELKRCRPDQLIWFLAPKVALCEQQYHVLRLAFPGMGAQLLSGEYADKLWTNKQLWEATLTNIRIIVSTPAVLNDAVQTHAYIHVSKLALIVVDEAHRCIGKSPMNVFMRSCFAATQLSQRPAVLGLSASPAMKADPKSLFEVEQSLHAITKTPHIHRLALEQAVNRPETHPVWYDPAQRHKPPMLCRLEMAKHSYDIQNDPYVLALTAHGGPGARDQVREVITKRKTFCIEQLKVLLNRATHVHEQLGPDAAEDYIWACKTKLEGVSRHEEYQHLLEWTSEEKTHLNKILEGVTGIDKPRRPGQSRLKMSDKFEKLIDTLTDADADTFTGIIFAQQRAVVTTLVDLLSRHPLTKDRFRIGCYVGSSTNTARKASIADLADVKGQQSTLQDFRLGDKNLVIATDVLEEGIDVPACNTIISFDSPPHLVSYIQRRGRARHRESRCLLFFPQESNRILEWQNLEKRMLEIYQDEKRAAEADAQEEDQDEDDGRTLRVASTGAILTLESSISHLYHFCQTLGSQYVDHQPRFTLDIDPLTNTKTAKVVLPSSVEPKLRTANSSRPWTTKRAALRDAAFVAYEALYRAGLINEHLLPLVTGDPDELDTINVEAGKSLMTVADLINPWPTIMDCCRITGVEISSAVVELQREPEDTILFMMLLPTDVLPKNSFQLYWNERTTYQVRMGAQDAVETPSQQHMQLVHQATGHLLSSVMGPASLDKKKTPFTVFAPMMSFEELSEWLDTVSAPRVLKDHDLELGDDIEIGNEPDSSPVRQMLLHDTTRSMARYIGKSLCMAVPSYDPEARPMTRRQEPQEELCVKATRLPKRRDFLHQVTRGSASHQKAAYTSEKYIPVGNCSVTTISSALAKASLLIPSILHVQEVTMIAHELRTTIMAPVKMNDDVLVLSAVSASSANEGTNYQRLEFLGDCVLKLCSSLQLMAAYSRQPEAYLTRMKSRLVSNDHLANAALDIGLDRFIITKAFTGQKWKPVYVEDCVDRMQDGKREMSKKVLADVVEALIGAAYLDDAGAAQDSNNSSGLNPAGLEKALSCIKLFLPSVPWLDMQQMQKTTLAQSLPTTNTGHKYHILAQAEQLLSYTFMHKSILLTALTHASYNADLTTTNYERLEFLGDALLDYIITSKLFAYRTKDEAELPHQTLHLLRTALVNRHFLAFLCLQHGVDVEHYEVETSRDPASPSTSTMGGLKPKETHTAVKRTTTHHLYQYMQRDTSAHQLSLALNMTTARFAQYSTDIASALNTSGARYPWLPLQRLDAPKCLSDIMESCIAAVWIDSGGNLQEVEKMLEAFGFFEVMQKLLDNEGQGVLHPKEEVGVLSAGVGVEYVVDVDGAKEDGVRGGEKEKKKKTVDCVLKIADIEISRVSEPRGTKKYLLETAVADLAVKEWERPCRGGEVVRERAEAADAAKSDAKKQGSTCKDLENEQDDDDDDDQSNVQTEAGAGYDHENASDVVMNKVDEMDCSQG